ncbi:hypothetical protein FA15DRAFT_662489 [Coprinopsis marcescibilis]|uniref:Uncharacterized protein n=1 Tax=Coprinopsis marcescibilis TaxID=230819 RepID=A0A5C3LP68_COPMA|nr:hypothetical protein FA15DRAFT_662489 [Coprinopsis marcescibilis]
MHPDFGLVRDRGGTFNATFHTYLRPPQKILRRLRIVIYPSTASVSISSGVITAFVFGRKHKLPLKGCLRNIGKQPNVRDALVWVGIQPVQERLVPSHRLRSFGKFASCSPHAERDEHYERRRRRTGSVKLLPVDPVTFIAIIERDLGSNVKGSWTLSPHRRRIPGTRLIIVMQCRTNLCYRTHG